VIEPLLILDSHEKWRPLEVESILRVPSKLNGQPLSSLDQLVGDGKIDMPADTESPTEPLVGYHRVVFAGGLWWHQFWTWWLYNPKKYAGFGEHEGDWEMVQLGCIDEVGDFPVLMTCSQHSGGEKREYWRVELTSDQPTVYVARDSHANYFSRHEDVTDQANGEGERLVLEWREFDTWAGFMGKWGNSENSPGPLTTRRAWQAPHAWHGQARG